MRSRLLIVPLFAALACRAGTIQALPEPDAPALTAAAPAAIGPLALADAFANEVTLRLSVPADEQLRYAALLSTALAPENLADPQYVLLVDRNPNVQAALLFFFDPAALSDEAFAFRFIGASPVSTGKPGRVDYFTTPTGVFPHTLANPDFRAEGTFNENGIRGYGLKGMRVYDFGWQSAIRGWGRRYFSDIRLQMHATDPDLLQPRLGSAQSKGCIRIHASLNTFLDRHAILDADYEGALADGRSLWVLSPDREPVLTPGRYLVIVDTQRPTRPAWSPLPKAH